MYRSKSHTITPAFNDGTVYVVDRNKQLWAFGELYRRFSCKQPGFLAGN